MPATRLQVNADRRAVTIRRDLADQLVRFADDAGVNQSQLAVAAGVARSHLVRVMAGEASASFEVYQRLAAVLGADLSVRFFPNTGALVRDRFAAPMLEHLLGVRHPRWGPFTEVGVRRPSRGWIDLVLHEPRERVLLASELQSELRRLEQLVRWHAAKADSLPSWEGFAHLGDEPRIGRLLVVRRTRATRRVAAEFARQLRAAYPAHPDDAIAALTGTAPWPGDALVWMAVEPGRTRLVTGR
jgi:transcriptional regulator with XRE-family HTH domain